MPRWWNTQLTTIRDALTTTPPSVDCSVVITLLGGSGHDIHHLSLALAGAVLTFWQLEKKLYKLLGGLDEREVVRMMDGISPLAWLRDESAGPTCPVARIQC